jgi:hypothetical protein
MSGAARLATAGGRFDPRDRHRYFMAGSLDTIELARPRHEHLLIAVNELMDDARAARVQQLIDSGATVFLDSGAFALAMAYARRHGIHFDEAMSLEPHEIDGYERLMDRYLELVDRWEPELWGYVELDFGGRDRKRATREAMERDGLRPIPVYHPFTDGRDYLDELCDRYDRLCLANISQASVGTREELIHTALVTRGDRPVWFHALGLSLHPLANAFPVESCDSSSWMESIRWIQGYRERCACQHFSEMPLDYRYALGDPEGRIKGTQMAAYGAHFYETNWRALAEVYRGF